MNIKQAHLNRIINNEVGQVTGKKSTHWLRPLVPGLNPNPIPGPNHNPIPGPTPNPIPGPNSNPILGPGPTPNPVTLKTVEYWKHFLSTS